MMVVKSYISTTIKKATLLATILSQKISIDVNNLHASD